MSVRLGQFHIRQLQATDRQKTTLALQPTKDLQGHLDFFVVNHRLKNAPA